MILRDALDIRRGTAQRSKIYKGTYKVWDRNKIVLEGYCKQNTTTGKNLLGLQNGTNTSGGLTVTRNNGLITFTGTASSTYPNTGKVPYTLGTGTYTISSTNNTYDFYLWFRNSSNETIYTANLAKSTKTITITTNDVASVIIGVEHLTTGTSYNLSTSIQIESGNSATPYEPYTGGIASPNPDYPQEIEVMEGKQVVNVSSENKFKMPLTIIAGAGTGITPTYNDDGSITLNGTSTGGVVEFRSIVQLSETHTLSYTSNKTSSNVYIRTRAYSSDETSFPSIQDSITLDQTSNSITSSKTFGFVCITIANNTTLDNFTIYPQLVTGSTATPYVPYKSQDFEVDLESKNKFDVSDIDNGYFTNDSGNLNNAGEGFHSNRYIGVDNGTIYIRLKALDNIKLGRFWIQEYDENKNSIVRHTIGIYDTNFEKEQVRKYTISLNSNTKYIRFSSYALLTLENEEYIMKTPTKDYFEDYVECTVSFEDMNTYEPYYNYKLAGIGDYKDNIYTKKGKWYVKSLIGKVVLDGSETWGVTDSGMATQLFVTTIEKTMGERSTIPIYSNMYKYVFWNDSPWNTNNSISYYSIDKIRIKDTRYTTVTDFKAGLSNNNVLVYYVLATPTEEEITSPTLIQQLNRLYQAM